MDDTFIDRLREEREQLFNRFTKLDEFLKGPLFEGLTSVEKIMLKTQYLTMVPYYEILDLRIKHYEGNGTGKIN